MDPHPRPHLTPEDLALVDALVTTMLGGCGWWYLDPGPDLGRARVVRRASEGDPQAIEQLKAIRMMEALEAEDR